MRGTAAAFVVVAFALTGCASPAITDAELTRVMDLRQQHLDEMATSLQLTDLPPTPEVVRWVGADEALAATAECLTAAGYKASPSDGGLSFENVGEGELDPGSAFWRVMWLCEAQYPVDPRTQVEFTERQYRILYRYFDLDLRDCLGSNGLTVSKAPPIDEFIERYYAGNPWDPWREVSMGDIGKTTWDRLQKECPPMPPAVQLYGPALPQG